MVAPEPLVSLQRLVGIEAVSELSVCLVRRLQGVTKDADNGSRVRVLLELLELLLLGEEVGSVRGEHVLLSGHGASLSGCERWQT